MGSATRTDYQALCIPRSSAVLRVSLWVIVVVLGVLRSWPHRFIVEYDSVPYLDVADAYLHFDWQTVINGFWSPLYSWLLAVPLSFLRASLYWESTLLHLVNFAVYLGSYAALEFLLRELMRYQHAESTSGLDSVGLPEAAWRVLGLALFLFSSFDMIDLNQRGPDLCVTVAVYVATGLLLRVQGGRAGWLGYGTLGLALGLGYLAKAAMFPMAFVYLGIALVAAGSPRKKLPQFVVAVVVFALVAGPWVAVLSRAKGRFTPGDVGTLNYVTYVDMQREDNELNSVDFWSVPLPPDTVLIHPPRQLYSDPRVFEFATPIKGTFPPWTDMSYWLEGAKARFQWKGQLTVLRRSYDSLMDVLNAQHEFVVGLLALLLLQDAVWAAAKRVIRRWVIWFPGITAIGMFSLVLIQARYIAPFLLLIWLGLFSALRFSRVENTQRWVRAVVFAIAVTTGVGLFQKIASDAFHELRPSQLHPTINRSWEVAEGLRRLGVPPGSSVVTVGVPPLDSRFPFSFYWARLAHVRVVALVPPNDVNKFWFSPPDVKAKLRSLFAATGSVAIVTANMPPGVTLPGWTQIGTTPYYVSAVGANEYLQQKPAPTDR